MRFGYFFRFLSGAAEYAKLSAETPDQVEADAARSRLQHRYVVIGGSIVAIVGVVFGVVGAVALIMHPSHANLRGDDIFLIIFEMFVMVSLGVLSGASWVCTFLHNSFFQTKAGVIWLKLLGTTKLGVARFVSFLVGLIGIAACIGLVVCIATGHV